MHSGNYNNSYGRGRQVQGYQALPPRTQQQSVNILYFSAFCKDCNLFKQELSRSKYNGMFKEVCVDPDMQTKRRPPLPPWLKKVPTLFLRQGNNTKVLEPKDAFAWLRGPTDRQGNPIRPREGGPPKMVDSTGLETFNGELSGYNPGYSMIDGTATGDGAGFSLLGQDQHINTPTDNGQDFKSPSPTSYNPNIPISNAPPNSYQQSHIKDPSKAQVLNSFDKMMQERAAERDAMSRGPRPI